MGCVLGGLRARVLLFGLRVSWPIRGAAVVLAVGAVRPFWAIWRNLTRCSSADSGSCRPFGTECFRHVGLIGTVAVIALVVLQAVLRIRLSPRRRVPARLLEWGGWADVRSLVTAFWGGWFGCWCTGACVVGPSGACAMLDGRWLYAFCLGCWGLVHRRLPYAYWPFGCMAGVVLSSARHACGSGGAALVLLSWVRRSGLVGWWLVRCGCHAAWSCVWEARDQFGPRVRVRGAGFDAGPGRMAGLAWSWQPSTKPHKTAPFTSLL